MKSAQKLFAHKNKFLTAQHYAGLPTDARELDDSLSTKLNLNGSLLGNEYVNLFWLIRNKLISLQRSSIGIPVAL